MRGYLVVGVLALASAARATKGKYMQVPSDVIADFQSELDVKLKFGDVTVEAGIEVDLESEIFAVCPKQKLTSNKQFAREDLKLSL